MEEKGIAMNAESNGQPADIAARLARLNSSIIADVRQGAGVVSPGLIRISGSGTVAGRAVTADCAEGSLQAVFGALAEARPGDILCMTAPGRTAYMGDLLATNLVQRGLAGAVVDGLVRDRETIAAMPISVHARGVTPAARRGREPGRSMTPIVLGEVSVSPGDWIIADADGVIVVPSAEIAAVLEKAEAEAEVEARIMARIKAGERVMDAVKAETGG